MVRLRIAGVIIPNDYKWYYEWFGEESTCPADVRKAIDDAAEDELIVEINSPGGEISAGSEIYTMLRACPKLKIEVTGQACSAASVIAMAGYCEMSPTALMMVHCVSTQALGNHNDMEHTADMLRTADEAISSAYMEKSGMSREAALEMMEQETWLTANRALELGLVDAVIQAADSAQFKMAAVSSGILKLPDEQQMTKVRAAIAETDKKRERARTRLKCLKLRKNV